MRRQYTCPQCGTYNPSAPLLVSQEPRAMCAHFTHRRFFDLAFRGEQITRRATLWGFATGVALTLTVAVYLLRCPQ